jgi:hypothetical protein
MNPSIGAFVKAPMNFKLTRNLPPKWYRSFSIVTHCYFSVFSYNYIKKCRRIAVEGTGNRLYLSVRKDRWGKGWCEITTALPRDFVEVAYGSLILNLGAFKVRFISHNIPEEELVEKEVTDAWQPHHIKAAIFRFLQ